jgi:hypothetical protein
MGRRHPAATTVTAGVAVALSLSLTACGSVAKDAAKDAAGAGLAPSASAAKAPPAADSRACAGAEAVIGHISVDTARWSPTRKPFDRAVAARIADRAGQLDAQAPVAQDPTVTRAVHSMSVAFSSVSRAMSAHKRVGVNQAITLSRVAYRELKDVCSLD